MIPTWRPVINTWKEPTYDEFLNFISPKISQFKGRTMRQLFSTEVLDNIVIRGMSYDVDAYEVIFTEALREHYFKPLYIKYVNILTYMDVDLTLWQRHVEQIRNNDIVIHNQDKKWLSTYDDNYMNQPSVKLMICHILSDDIYDDISEGIHNTINPYLLYIARRIYEHPQLKFIKLRTRREKIYIWYIHNILLKIGEDQCDEITDYMRHELFVDFFRRPSDMLTVIYNIVDNNIYDNVWRDYPSLMSVLQESGYIYDVNEYNITSFIEYYTCAIKNNYIKENGLLPSVNIRYISLERPVIQYRWRSRKPNWLTDTEIMNDIGGWVEARKRSHLLYYYRSYKNGVSFVCWTYGGKFNITESLIAYDDIEPDTPIFALTNVQRSIPYTLNDWDIAIGIVDDIVVIRLSDDQGNDLSNVFNVIFAERFRALLMFYRQESQDDRATTLINKLDRFIEIVSDPDYALRSTIRNSPAREDFRIFLHDMVALGLIFRRWRGPGHPFPYSQDSTNDVRVNPDILASPILSKYRNLSTDNNSELFRLVSKLYSISYDGDNIQGKFIELLNKVINGKQCIRLASRYFIGTAVKALRKFFNEQFKDGDNVLDVDRLEFMHPFAPEE